MNVRLFFFVSLLLGSLLPAQAQAPSYCQFGADHSSDSSSPRAEIAHDYDVLHYRLEIAVDRPRREITGRAVIRIRAVVDPLTEIDLDLRRIGLDDVRIDGQTVAFSRSGGVIAVTLDREYAAGEELEIEVLYGGEPEDGFFFRPGTVFTRSQPDKAKFWFPCWDRPSDKATSETITTVSTGQVVVSNGRLLSVTDNGDGTTTHHWSEESPIATYLISLAISDYVTFGETFNGLPVDFYVRPAELDAARVDFEDTVDMLSFYTELLLPYPFEKYAMATAPFSSAMEHQTCTTFGSSLVTGNKLHQGIVAHELAHSWFGNLVTLIDDREMWLNEGFATYFDALYTESREGGEAFRTRIRNFHDRYLNNESIEGRFPIYDPRELFGATVYFKGASILHMLRRVTGDEGFFAAMRDYLTLFAFGNVSTEDLRAVVESRHGESLEWFFDQWVYDQGYPEIDSGFHCYPRDGGGFWLELSFQQIQDDAPIFRLPLDLVAHTDSGDEAITVELTGATHRFLLPVSARVTGLSVDPDAWALMRQRDVGPARAFRTGNVGAGAGEVENVLFVGTPDGLSVGDPADRVLEVRRTDPLDLFVAAPRNRPQSRFAAYCIFGEPVDENLFVVPEAVGTAVVPLPFGPGNPSVLFNNLGQFRFLGRPRLQATPAPVLAHTKPDGLRAAELAVQAMIRDDASLSPLGLSLSNAVIVRTIP